MMLCNEFEERLTNYLDGELPVEEHRAFSEHALRCPLCHELLADVKQTIVACLSSEAPPAGVGLEARILMTTAPQTAITCEEFEDHLTDYLDGVLMAPLYHRWERHAALCSACSELPGQVVRSIGAVYTYAQDELPVPAGLEARILQATIGNVLPRQVRAPFLSRMVEWLRGALDPLVSPQLASVATMLLVSVFVLTNTVSTDGSVRGLYRASLQLAERTADSATRGSEKGVKQFAGSVNKLVGGEENQKDNEKSNEANQNQNSSNQNSATPRPQSPEGKTGNGDSKKR
ncbi:MAG TPA: zf-HC2 domain-containing protein [Pyrinomonadaceae bacterium]|nr:zf-HC2 domain-containing protein [Pyrinomonadaceae bacterium]